MPKFGVAVQDMTTGTAVKGALAWTTAVLEDAEIIELIMTGSGTTAAADTQHQADLSLSSGTTEAVGTGITPTKFDERSAVAKLTVEHTLTTEQAVLITPPVVAFGFNQRGGMRWAVPRGEGVWVRGNDTNEDIAFRVDSTAAGKVDACAHFWEP